MRLNCLGSLYYFIKIGLKRRRLTLNLHKPICDFLEREHIKDVYELPRDHFKSTICSEGLPLWRVLPLTDNDILSFTNLGYPPEFLRWLQNSHRSEARNLLVSENITNAAKLGKRIAFHYESNAIFRHLFPEIIPTSSQTWSNFSLHHRVLKKGQDSSGGHGEGTFDFLGVGSALQSRHYNGIIIEDDLVGRKAVESQSIMDKTIEYHQLMAGVFENEHNIEENDELVVGNRWGYIDLNSWIREHEPWFNVSSHSALGGCCSEHPPDTPIFNEEFTFDKLLRLRERLGSYMFSCQFLNNPAAPENADFKKEDLRYFAMEKNKDNEWTIQYDVFNGIVKKDYKVSHLNLCLVTDPNHSGNSGMGRCRHSIIVLGLSAEGDYHLIDCWAQASNFDTYINEIYKMADKWKIRKIGVESVAAQKYLIYHINYRNKLESRTLRIIPLEGEVEAPDGTMTRKKEWRIRNILSPIFESGHFYTQKRFTDFEGEFQTFPKGRFVDILDAMAYAPQLLKLPQGFLEDIKMRAMNNSLARKVRQPYSVGV
jgi:hypothetical protein